MLPRVDGIDPLHVPPKEAPTRGVRIARLVAVLVVYTMNASPPQRRALETANPAEHPEAFEKRRERNRAVGQHPVKAEIDS